MKSPFSYKSLFFCFALILISILSNAQAPESFSYQGVALDAKGVPVVSKQISLRISILQGSLSGTEVLKETHTPTTDKYGQFSVAIGQGTAVSGSMSAIQWGSSSHYLKAEIDINGGSSYVSAGTSQLLSVPYAINALKASAIDTFQLADSLGNIKGGQNAFQNNKTGVSNIALGKNALNLLDSGSYNVAIGENALSKLNKSILESPVDYFQIGNYNVAVGYNSLQKSLGDRNTSVGANSLEKNVSGWWNTAMGNASMQNNENGYRNTAIGYGSMIHNIDGNQNVALGSESLLNNFYGSNNVALGMKSLFGNQFGNNNSIIGFNAAEKMKIGDGNVVLGSQGGWYMDSSSFNVLIGNDVAMDPSFNKLNNRLIIANSNTTSPLIYGEFDNKKLQINGDLEITGNISSDTLENTKIGTLALSNITPIKTFFIYNSFPIRNVGIGFESLYSNSTGHRNTAIGAKSLHSNTKGSLNTAIGHLSMYGNTEGVLNTAIGNGSMSGNITGIYNTAIGVNALGLNDSGNRNTAIGLEALLDNHSGNENVAIGYGANVRFDSLSNIAAIGSRSVVSTSNTVSIGNRNVTKWVFGLETTSDSGYAFQVGSTTSNGNGAYLTNGGTWTNSSSRDFKENFEDIDGSDLLDRIEKMKVQKWVYKGTDEVHIGPVAEEFKSLFNLGVKNDDKHISTLDASGIALRSVQELKKKLDEKDKQINELKSRLEENEKMNKDLEFRFDEMQKMINQLLESKK